MENAYKTRIIKMLSTDNLLRMVAHPTFILLCATCNEHIRIVFIYSPIGFGSPRILNGFIIRNGYPAIELEPGTMILHFSPFLLQFKLC